jgi:hypothetical protein
MERARDNVTPETVEHKKAGKSAGKSPTFD